MSKLVFHGLRKIHCFKFSSLLSMIWSGKYIACALVILTLIACKKESKPPPSPPATISLVTSSINNIVLGDNTGINSQPEIRLRLSQPLQPASLSSGIVLTDGRGINAAFSSTLSNGDSVVVLKPSRLNFLTRYDLSLGIGLTSRDGGRLATPVTKSFSTGLDSSRKFSPISDDSLLTLVQKQTFKYFWDFAHPVSGLARERSNGNNNLVTSGGSGFGIMALIVGADRGFVTHAQALTRLQTIVAFLKNQAQTFHGAFPHWLDGTTGAVIPFSPNDDGADLVETSYLVQGLLCARQYFNDPGTVETTLRTDINSIVDKVEWNWFRQNNQNVLYWHWSQDKGWIMNMKILGWNECLITYALAATSATYSIPKTVYDAGWARNGAIRNGKAFYGYTLPLGEDYGGPLFFEHYSFLGLNPKKLKDTYADYTTQTTNHTLINFNYCRSNPKGFYGYSDSVWGLTASDIKGGYTASSPSNDQGYIAPTAAISSLPYTPNESMAALKFYYYVLGDKIWKDYGFIDAFTLDVLKNNGPWFAGSHLAIDQGPIIVMIENYRTGLLWNLLMSCPEVRNGLTKLGFTGL